MQSLARQGRTVFVSSHLMSEMALTASRVIVIGKGHLIADSTVDALVKGSASVVRLRTPMAEAVSPRLQAAGGTVQTSDDGALMVTGLEPSAIGDIAFYAQAPVHELYLLQASLEEAFMELTRDDVEYHAHGGSGAPEAPGQEDDRPPLAGWPSGPATPAGPVTR
jgi:ABC-2 type transport system ATP-binding protein